MKLILAKQWSIIKLTLYTQLNYIQLLCQRGRWLKKLVGYSEHRCTCKVHKIPCWKKKRKNLSSTCHKCIFYIFWSVILTDWVTWLIKNYVSRVLKHSFSKKKKKMINIQFVCTSKLVLVHVIGLYVLLN